MAPKRATRSTPAATAATTSVTNAQLQAIIDQGVTASLAARDANRSTNGDDSHVSGIGVRRTERVARERVIDDLIDISGERSSPKYLKIFIEQQITDHRRFIAHMRDEIRTSTNLISQLNTLIVELEAFGDYEEVFDLVMELRDDRRNEQDKVADFNRLIDVADEKIHGKEIDLEMLEAEGNDVAVGCAVVVIDCCGLWPCLIFGHVAFALDSIRGYFDEVQEGHFLEGCYRNPNRIKLSATFDALNRISGKHRALFSSFLGDLVREHIGRNNGCSQNQNPCPKTYGFILPYNFKGETTGHVLINGAAKEIGMAVVLAVTKAGGMEVTRAVDSYLVGEDIRKQIKALLQSTGTSFCPNYVHWFGIDATDVQLINADRSVVSKFLQASPSDYSTTS
ncbi:reverse transcriptase domain-containing protein [Tanacetum coccineum]